MARMIPKESDTASLIENYGLLGDLHGSALVSRDGSMDWLCLPRFDSEACMAALLGRDEHGHWLHHPGAAVRCTSRRYRPGTMILETDYDAFTQAYSSEALDTSLLLMPALGFLPASDPRVQGTINAIEKNLVRDGFVLRYQSEHAQDGLTGSEGAFLADRLEIRA